jgi:lipopolysaccharide export system protein LptA
MIKVRDSKSIIIILFFIGLNGFILSNSFKKNDEEKRIKPSDSTLAPNITVISNLEYFHLKNGAPELSLHAERMDSVGEDYANFVIPKGIFSLTESKKTVKYEASLGEYQKNKKVLTLSEKVKLETDSEKYRGDEIKYHIGQDLIVGKGNIHLEGLDPKTRDQIKVYADSIRSYPKRKLSYLTGGVKGEVQRLRKYEGTTKFQSRQMELNGSEGKATLDGDVQLSRQNYLVTGGKADIFFENYNKSLKYFVMNDDVKMTETMTSPRGENTVRRAYSERLEGFGQEQKMVLSGAPRVEQGSDVIKGYRITIRQNIDLIEVDDSMSDMQIKKSKQTKE